MVLADDILGTSKMQLLVTTTNGMEVFGVAFGTVLRVVWMPKTLKTLKQPYRTP